MREQIKRWYSNAEEYLEIGDIVSFLVYNDKYSPLDVRDTMIDFIYNHPIDSREYELKSFSTKHIGIIIKIEKRDVLNDDNFIGSGTCISVSSSIDNNVYHAVYNNKIRDFDLWGSTAWLIKKVD